MGFHTGTCSWAEKALIESREFYPQDVTSPEERLRYYALHFDTVEVDSSYYAIPRRENAALWAARTPEGFVFHVKAYGAMTGHAVQPKTLPKDLFNQLPEKDRAAANVYVKEPELLAEASRTFTEALMPLKDAGKLGLIVFQFPPWFYYGKKNMDDILKRAELAAGLSVAVEFRHGSWLTPDRRAEVLGFLRDHRLTYITADEPQFGTLATVPLVPAVTTDIAYFRLHGRNRETWMKKGAQTSEKFAYRYSDDELGELGRRITGMREIGKTREVYVMFNNHGSPGILNARTMKVLLKGPDGSLSSSV